MIHEDINKAIRKLQEAKREHKNGNFEEVERLASDAKNHSMIVAARANTKAVMESISNDN